MRQEEINKEVHECCVLFCENWGCGIHRNTCTSLGTCDEHDKFRDIVRKYLTRKHYDKERTA